MINCEYFDIYIIIDKNIVLQICEILHFKFVSFFKFKFLRRYDEQLIDKFIIYYLFSNLNVNDYKKEICFILIIFLNIYKIIFEKL